jgi:hypothetical protein
MRKRAQYGKGSEKPKESSESKSASDGSKDEDEGKQSFFAVLRID